jgi:hypothetical protein
MIYLSIIQDILRYFFEAKKLRANGKKQVKDVGNG